jgi:hypothetical protein
LYATDSLTRKKPGILDSDGNIDDLGVLGSLSAISSIRASSVKTMRVTRRPKKASLVPAKCNQPRCAAQQTVAGGVSERSPVTQPRRKQRRSKVMTGSALSLEKVP